MKNIFSISGNTPLIKITDKIYGKLETYNPTGSVKDRVIFFLVDRAVRSGIITKKTVLCEATSGNTGISLSAAAASLGLKCIIFMPTNMSEERKKMMRLYGAQIIEAPPNDFIGAIHLRDQYLEEHSNSWSPNQFSNPDNILCHREITAPEIFDDVQRLGKNWSAFIHGAGTGGTIEGVRSYLKAGNLDTKVCLVEPLESPHGIQGISDGREFLARSSDMDHTIKISTSAAMAKCEDFARTTGIFIGISAAANILASEKYCKKFSFEGIVVTMLCDRGERYLSLVG